MEIEKQLSAESTNGNGVINNELVEHCDSDWVPKVGMVFDSEADALKFYTEYARKTGFGIRKGIVHRRAGTGTIIDRIFFCCREGFRKRDKRDANVKKHRAETRVGCLARLRIIMNADSKYEVVQFNSEHNHQLVLPSMVHLLRSHRHLTTSQAAAIDLAETSGIAPKATAELMGREASSVESLGFMRRDCNNYLHSKRMAKMQRGDAGALLEYFQKKQADDPLFFYAIQLDDDELITNIFWADVRMMWDYRYFGDVVCFDTTYKTNKEGRPFSLFVGVNHHRQSIVFGAALLYDETIQTYCWLFETFVRAMSGKKPKTILTDHDQAMTNAIASMLPGTCHRFCVWHMFQNAAKHLSDVFTREKSFVKDFSPCVYDYENEEDFVEAWTAMLNKYNLSSNPWLQARFNERDKWSITCGRSTFCADMSNIQRSESMNTALKGYLNTQKDVLSFLEHFERMLEDRRYEELKSDCKMMNSIPATIGNNGLLDSVKGTYTAAVFQVVQQEIFDILNCYISNCGEAGTTIEYKVVNNSVKRPREHTVIYDHSTITVSCSCKKFEYAGILCCHALSVLRENRIKKVPDSYILKRWTKYAKSGEQETDKHGLVLQNDSKLESGRRYKDLCHLFIQIAKKASEYPQSHKFATDLGKKMQRQVENVVNDLNTKEPLNDASHMESIPDGHIHIEAGSTCIDSVYDDDFFDEDGGSAEMCSRAKGIKRNVRGGRAGTSVRRVTNALGKAIKQKGKKVKESTDVPHNASKPNNNCIQAEASSMLVGTGTPFAQSLTKPPAPSMKETLNTPVSSAGPITPFVQYMGFSHGLQENVGQGTYCLTQGCQTDLNQGSQLKHNQHNYGFTQVLQPFLPPRDGQYNAK